MELIGVYLDYRKYLKDQLGLKALANPQYSLRAFARDLEISPQVLSSVLSGKKNISSEVALELAQRLKLSDEERSYFYDLVELSQAKTQNLREIIQYRLSRYEQNKSYRTIQEDVFKIIADWHHAAILELTETDDFKNDPQWISTRLGITPQEARLAVERLLLMELLEVKGKTLKKSDFNFATHYDVPSAALRKSHSQLLEKAISAIEEQSVGQREYGTMIMAIDPKKLPEAKKKIRKFRKDLSQYLESGDRTEIYAISTQLFSLSKLPKKGSTQ